MKVSTQQLIEIVDDQAPTRDPLVMLEAAVRVAEQVGGMADAMVDHYVAASRAVGLSRTEIGERLGVSKQAARQRASSGSPVGSVNRFSLPTRC